MILRAASLTPTPWKNGGGVTTEYAVHPVGAGFDDFDWRISRAEVACDGPFSLFPGIDRTLTVLSGAGIVLHFTDRTVRLTPQDPPFAFPGDVPVTGKLLDGPIEDLNVMTRRGRWRHRVDHAGDAKRGDADVTICFALADGLWAGHSLSRFDALVSTNAWPTPVPSPALLIQLQQQP